MMLTRLRGAAALGFVFVGSVPSSAFGQAVSDAPEVLLPPEVVRLQMRWDSEGTADEQVTVRLKPRAKLERILAGLRRPWLFDEFTCEPRCGLTLEQRVAALEVARRTLRAVSADWSIDASLSTADQSEDWYAFQYAARILITWGDVGDVARLLDAREGERIWGLERRMAAAALLETRLGRLDDGELAARLERDDPEIAARAASLLDALGSRVADEVLYTSLAEPTNPQLSALAALGLLDHFDRRTLDAMRAFLTRIEALPAKDWPSHGAWASNPWVPAVSYLLAFGEAADRARAARCVLGSAHAELLAYLVEDPAPLLAGLAHHSGWSEVGSAAQALRTLSPERAELVEQKIRAALQEHGSSVRPEGDQFSPEDQAYRQTLFYEMLRSYERPVEGVAERVCLQQIWLGETPWIATPWKRDEALDALVAGTIAQGGREQLDYVPHAEIAAGFAARGALETLRDAEVFLAYHEVATRAFQRFPDAFPGGLERRPYVLSHAEDGSDGGAISGVLFERASLEGTRLSVELALDQEAYYHVGSLINFKGNDPSAWEHHRYVENEGRALVSEVRVRRGDAFLEVDGPGVVPDAAIPGAPLAYEVELEVASLADLWVEVRFDFFGASHDFVFPLWASDLAHARPASQVATTVTPEVPAGDLFARAHAAEAAGDLESAWLSYRMILVDRPWDRALWFQATELFASHAEHARAADVLWAMVQYYAADPDVWFDLGTELYFAGDYEGAGEAYRTALLADPSQEEPKLWWGACLWLEGRFEDAREVFASVESSDASERVATMRYLLAQTGDPAALDTARAELEAFAAAAEGTGASERAGLLLGTQELEWVLAGCDGSAALAKAHCYAGYRHLIAGETDAARAAFEAARAAGADGVLEGRMAEVELADLAPPR